MNRVEFMTEMAILLQDIPAEERREAMQYYNDYFDDAGALEEANIISELGSPEKVALEVKAGLNKQEEEVHEYRETGYTDTRFEYKESPVEYGFDQKKDNADKHSCGTEETEEGSGSYHYVEENEASETVYTGNFKILKIVLQIVAALIVIPIIGPVVIGLVVAAAGILIAIVAVFLSLVVISGSVAVAGVALFVAGLVTVITNIAAGLMLTGSGLIVTVLGLIATVGSVRLCIIVFPAIVKGIVWLCKKPFQHGKAVA